MNRLTVRNWGRRLVSAAMLMGSLTAVAGVTCRVEPDYGVREADKPGTAYVKVTLAADKVAAKSRPSVNLSIVLDRSELKLPESVRYVGYFAFEGMPFDPKVPAGATKDELLSSEKRQSGTHRLIIGP